MAATLKLYLNTMLKTLQYSSSSGRIVSLPTLQKYETVPLEITLVDPDPNNQINGFILPDIANISLRVAVHSGYDTSSPLAQQTTFTKDTTKRTFTGELALNTSAFNSWIGSAATASGYFEVEWSEGTSTRKATFPVTVRNSVQQQATTAPTPITEYLTRAEASASYAKHIGGAGQSITLTSPDGTKQIVLSCGDDGTFLSESTTA